MFGRVYSGGLCGVDAYRIEVEVDCSSGIGQIHIVGLPDAAVKESQERVRSAIKSCEFFMPCGKKWVVNMAPADTRKEGPAFDLPIAVGILAASGYVPPESLGKYWMLGELGLDGSVRPVNGVLPVASACRSSGTEKLIVPEGNSTEAALVDGLDVFPVTHLKQVLNILSGNGVPPVVSSAKQNFLCVQKTIPPPVLDFGDVKGQSLAKRALTIAAAGRHNILMMGPPGSGKSMLAQRLPGIMPPLEFREALEITKLYSVAGLLANKNGIISERPFRSPHHSASVSGLIGGGSYPRPGEISLSHLGVLFLDELTEFPRSYLDALRQPLEAGVVTISRASQTLTYPASFLLVGACNPCPCGYRGDQFRYCTCTRYQADRYWSRLSGPFLDRIDLQIQVSRLSEYELAGTQNNMNSESMRLVVQRAVAKQKGRFPDEGSFVFNGQLSQAQLRKYCVIGPTAQELLARAVTQLGLSARSYDRILRISRTIADMDDCDNIEAKHVAEALRYRVMHRDAV